MNVLLQSLYLTSEKLTSYVYIREHRLRTYTYLLRMVPEMSDVSDGALPSQKTKYYDCCSSTWTFHLL